MTNKELAVKILELVGGKDNISACTHCITRLRLTINDFGKIKEEEIKKLPGVMGTNTVKTQFQIILGPKVADVFFEFEPLVGLKKGEEEPKEKKKLVSVILDTFTGIFTPILPAIIGAGLLKGILLGLMFAGAISTDGDAFKLLMVFTDAAYYFLPMLLAASTATHFKCNRYVAMAIAGIMIHPDMVTMLTDGTTHHLLGLPITSTTYGSTVLPIILTILAMSYIEKFFAKAVPSILRTILVPLLTLLVTGSLGLLVLGPIGSIVSNAIASNFLTFYVNYGVIAGAIFSGLLPFMILLGIHNGFTPVMVQCLATYNVEYLMGLNVTSNSAQAGATFAVFLKTKNKDFKALAGTATLNAILGITEPALYGITSKLKRPLIGVCIGGAVGGAIAGLFHVSATGIATGPIIGIPLFLTDTFIWFVVSCMVSFVIAFAFVMVTGFEDVPEGEYDEGFQSVEKSKQKSIESGEEEETIADNITIASPLTGKTVKMEDVKDNVFASKMMGDGIAVEPVEGIVYAPFDGNISVLFDTKHCVGIHGDNGCDILIHVGIDTVQLEGKYYEYHVEKDQKVKKGDILLEFDIDKIKAAGYDVTTPIIIVNTDNYTTMEMTTQANVEKGELLLTATV